MIRFKHFVFSYRHELITWQCSVVLSVWIANA